MMTLLRLVVIGGAFCFAVAMPAVPAMAQVVVPPASEVPIPPKPGTDTTAPKPDTIKAPFGRAVGPKVSDIGPNYEWNRAQMFSTGAYTVADLLERVPGATSFRTGWLASPKYVAVNGDLRRIVIVYDGIEVDNVDPRSVPLLDLTTIELWTLEKVSIERFANELRVHLTSWRVDRTSPYTRTDLYTGDEQTNMYRAFYGKRFNSGAGIQFGAQQWSSRSNRLGGGGDALSFIGRAGITRRMWSIDAYALSRNASRVLQPANGEGLSLQPFEGTHSVAYLRVAAGDAARGPWIQATAANLQLRETSPFVTPADALARRIRPDSADSTTRRMQYVISAGTVQGFLNTSITDRVRSYDGMVTHSPSVRFEVSGSKGLAGFFGERNGDTRRARADGVVTLTPVPFLAVSGAVSTDSRSATVLSPQDTSAVLSLYAAAPTTISARIEAGVKLGGPWLVAGFITRDTAILAPPSAIDSAYAVRSVGRRQGIYGALRGTLYKDIHLEALGTRWDSAGFYQPRYQSRSEMNIDTRWLSRFPSGTFGFKLAAIHEYRSEVDFPTSTGVRRADPSNVFDALLEIRILRGVASYQIRNAFGYTHQIVPDFFMPRAIGIYGIRWEFWN
ncbi:MAG: Plug domain-containing protein [Gemmatimonadaceae bacterium]